MAQRSKRPRLGKGLASLIHNSTLEQSQYQPITEKIPGEVALTGEITLIAIENISTNPTQPRRNFNETSLAQLADSIRTYGMLQPVLVKRFDEHGDHHKFQLIA